MKDTQYAVSFRINPDSFERNDRIETGASRKADVLVVYKGEEKEFTRTGFLQALGFLPANRAKKAQKVRVAKADK